MNFQELLDVLPIAGAGWGGVFGVIIVIWVAIALMLRIFKKD
ncbi:MAG: OadG-related small transporter subunit [Eubacteriales bacterium]|nr:OadG-related small transporter subunit [Eubacteriales bacterium]